MALTAPIYQVMMLKLMKHWEGHLDFLMELMSVNQTGCMIDGTEATIHVGGGSIERDLPHQLNFECNIQMYVIEFKREVTRQITEPVEVGLVVYYSTDSRLETSSLSHSKKSFEAKYPRLTFIGFIPNSTYMVDEVVRTEVIEEVFSMNCHEFKKLKEDK